MKFDSLAELRIYDQIAQPVVIVDDKNRIIHCNAPVRSFFNLVLESAYINEDINNIIKFRSKEDEKIHWVDFYNMECEQFNTISEINQYVISDVNMHMIKASIENQPCKFILISSSELKESFFNSFEEREKQHEVNEKFNYIDIKDSLKKYNSEEISEELAIGIVNVTPTGIVIEKNGKIVAVNNSAKDILGIVNRGENKEDYLGKSLLEIVEIASIEYSDELITEAYEKLAKTNVIDKKFIRRDNSSVYCEVTTMFFQEQEHKYYIYFLRDITNRVKLESNLISNKNSYMKMVEFLPIGVMIHTNNKFNGGNRAQEKIFGVDDINTLDNKDIIDMIHNDYKKLYWEMYYNTFTTGRTTDLNEIKIVRRDGKVIEVEMIMMTMRYEGNKSVIILTQEITDRKKAQIDKLRLEETIKYDQLKTEFISNVSHELKTPLNIILSTVQLLQYNYKDSEDDQLKRYLDLTKINSYRLLRLINNLIDGTRIDVGDLKMNFANYNIVKIVEDITMEAVEYVENKGLTITFDTNIEEKIIGVDKDNIERIMLNLLSNAVKFSKEGGKVVVQVIDEGDIIKIKVVDDGKGISKEDQDKIFDKFVQVEQLFTRSHEGSGIGLSLVKSIVENHGGNIYVKSELGKGSEFTVELPNMLSKKVSWNKHHTINQVSSTEKVKIEFSDI